MMCKEISVKYLFHNWHMLFILEYTVLDKISPVIVLFIVNCKKAEITFGSHYIDISTELEHHYI